MQYTTARSPMLLERWAIYIGNILMLAGVLGFIPGITEHQALFGLLSVTPWQNALHIAAGVLGVAAGLIGAHAARRYFQVFGMVLLMSLLLIIGLLLEGWYVGEMIGRASFALYAGLSMLALFAGYSRDVYDISTAGEVSQARGSLEHIARSI